MDCATSNQDLDEEEPLDDNKGEKASEDGVDEASVADLVSQAQDPNEWWSDNENSDGEKERKEIEDIEFVHSSQSASPIHTSPLTKDWEDLCKELQISKQDI
jgi:hypothetical protein